MLDQISAREIAVSGLRAQRARMNIIANNIANANATRTPEGGAFRRQMVILQGEPIRSGSNMEKAGVQVQRIMRDPAPFRPVYQPGHPDANSEGYVDYPNITIAVEMADLVSAQRAYEANIAVLVSGAQMHDRALQIIEV